MKKWLIPDIPRGIVKLVAGLNCPEGAVCEAPDNYTNEMEPFIKLAEKILPDGSREVVPELDKAYHEWLDNKDKTNLPTPVSDKLLQELAVSRVKVQEKEYFNTLNPFQRFVKSILGEVVHSAESLLLQTILKAIFGNKVQF